MLTKPFDKEKNTTVKKIKLEDSVGTLLAHDITEIVPGKFKGAAFNAGHKVTKKDLCHLKRLGKRHLFVLNLNKHQIHENEAVIRLAKSLLSSGIKLENKPKEGKIHLKASLNGLFKCKIQTLLKLNMFKEVISASIHNNTTVTINSKLAAIRIMPLFVNREKLNTIIDFIHTNNFIFEVKPFRQFKIGLIITGNEIYDGLIEDKFENIIKEKLKQFNLTLSKSIILPDDIKHLSFTIKDMIANDVQLIITTGGMSIDPDDITRYAVETAGADEIYYGAAVTPGSMFQLAYIDNIPVMGVPACALYHKTTIFDLILPRLLVGEELNSKDLANFAHGGLCLNCKQCIYPHCPFGKN